MSISRRCNSDLENMLDMVVCAPDYGINHYVLMNFLADMMNRQLSDDEIEEFTKLCLTPEYRERGYSEEDYACQIERLKEFKSKYIPIKTST